MITVYKKKAILKSMELVSTNDIFFNQKTVELLDEKAADIIRRIDNAELIDKYHIKSSFDNSVLNIDVISTGCKTILNIIYNPDMVFDITECGENAVDVIYSLPQGNIYCSYPLISFDMKEVTVCDSKGKRTVSSYDELKEWWTSEN